MLHVSIDINAQSSTRYTERTAPESSIGWNPDIPDSGSSIDTLMPRTIGANSTAVPIIMSVMLLSLSSSPVLTVALFWNCLPTAIASLPASTVSPSEHLRMSRYALDTSWDTDPMLLSTAEPTSPRQRPNSRSRARRTSAHSGRPPMTSGQTFSKLSPVIILFPSSNTESRRPCSHASLRLSERWPPTMRMDATTDAGPTERSTTSSKGRPWDSWNSAKGMARSSGDAERRPSLLGS